MTLTQAADILGITPDALRMAIHRGRVPAIKVGNTWTVKPKDLETYRTSKLKPGRKPKA